VTGRKPRYQIVDGFRLPLDFPADGFRSGLRYTPAAGDIFVSTYPKCGTTWVQHIIYLLLHDGEALPPNKSLTDVFPHLEEAGRAAVEALPEPRLIKTHLPLSLAPFAANAKYVYVARNPFDCAVSFFHHTRGFVKHYDFADGTFDEFFECFIRGEVDFGDYFENLLPWYAQRHAGNLHFMTYEELKRDTARGVLGLGVFLGGAAAQAARDAALLERVLERSSFEKMSEDQQRWSSKRPDSMPQFVRKGLVGDWQNYFSQDQLRRLLHHAEERAANSGALDLWADVFEAVRERVAVTKRTP
jgi:hypothetical protein